MIAIIDLYQLSGNRQVYVDIILIQGLCIFPVIWNDYTIDNVYYAKKGVSPNE